MIADPVCHCGAKKVWIGIGGGAEAVCIRCLVDQELATGIQCPTCKSNNTRLQINYRPIQEWNCLQCKRVWFRRKDMVP